jgi:hypothetical protein
VAFEGKQREVAMVTRPAPFISPGGRGHRSHMRVGALLIQPIPLMCG